MKVSIKYFPYNVDNSISHIYITIERVDNSKYTLVIVKSTSFNFSKLFAYVNQYLRHSFGHDFMF